MALPPDFLEELRGRTPLPALIGRRMRLARSGRQWKGCCPFHGEKTPSFYVYDDHYHCFGCGVHGDAISFVMQAQGAGFMEAVAQLAAEAGLDVPQEKPRETEAERRRHDLRSVLEAAEAAFVRRLHAPEGAPALAYLQDRGLSAETIARFGLGWSGAGRGALSAELASQGIEPAVLQEAGLMQAQAEEPDGRAPRELFFNRVIFPIRDRRGRTISFGGRTLGEGQPKYLNGPETAVFSKRRTLYALDLAREGVRKGAVPLVVEGYMDVIALHQAGFHGAVAPLGTALTAEQLETLWQIAEQPILCFDGDAAGSRAALRAMETALPLLGARRTLRIAALPAGEDPDSLVRRRGPDALQAELDNARPLADALFDFMREGTKLGTREETPELRAAFLTRLNEQAARIPDRILAGEYRQALRNRLFESSRSGRTRAAREEKKYRPPRRLPAPAASEAERLRLLTAILLRHPTLLHDVEDAYARLDLPPPLARIRDALGGFAETAELLESAGLLAHLSHSGLDGELSLVMSSASLPLIDCAGPGAMPAEAEAGWWHLYGLTYPDRLEADLARARDAFARAADRASERRLITLAAARNKLARGEQDAEVDA